MSTAAMFDTSMKSLAVRLLGEFAVDGVESQALGSRKARLALHLLALADGQPVPDDVLADALWADTPPAKPEDQLAVLMSRLRGVLGRDRIEHRSGGYLLHADWQDDTELSQLTAETERRRSAGNVVGAAAAARVGLSLLRGAGPAQLPGEWAQLRRAGGSAGPG
jgi:DNA-binding SARP family transcriptional activator